jgi:hypothetical protein
MFFSFKIVANFYFPRESTVQLKDTLTTLRRWILINTIYFSPSFNTYKYLHPSITFVKSKTLFKLEKRATENYIENYLKSGGQAVFIRGTLGHGRWEPTKSSPGIILQMFFLNSQATNCKVTRDALICEQNAIATNIS